MYCTNKNLSLFMAAYLDALSRVKKDGFKIDPNTLKILDYVEQIGYNMENDWPDKGIYKACESLYSTMYADSAREQDKKILEHFGINEKPEQVLFDSKKDIPSKKFVYAFLIDYDSPDDQYGHARNYGEGERFYGSGKSTTREEFLKELKETYKGCWWTEVSDVSSVCEEPEATLYEYRGYLYRYYKN